MVHLQAAFQKQLLDVTVAERITQVPGDRLEDQRRLEMPTLDVVLGPVLNSPLTKSLRSDSLTRRKRIGVRLWQWVGKESVRAT